MKEITFFRLLVVVDELARVDVFPALGQGLPVRTQALPGVVLLPADPVSKNGVLF